MNYIYNKVKKAYVSVKIVRRLKDNKTLVVVGNNGFGVEQIVPNSKLKTRSKK